MKLSVARADDEVAYFWAPPYAFTDEACVQPVVYTIDASFSCLAISLEVAPATYPLVFALVSVARALKRYVAPGGRKSVIEVVVGVGSVTVVHAPPFLLCCRPYELMPEASVADQVTRIGTFVVCSWALSGIVLTGALTVGGVVSGGCTVGVGVGVGVAVGVAVGVGEAVGEAVGVAVGEAVGLAELVGLAVTELVGLAVGDGLGVGGGSGVHAPKRNEPMRVWWSSPLAV